mmetsp:Transcript_39968/g.66533  ORF Transcript_39968/g.66533 Transcript_39968/m.66533 type:complete len:283 (+) Transcript_39968:1406-2254(+)
MVFDGVKSAQPLSKVLVQHLAQEFKTWISQCSLRQRVLADFVVVRASGPSSPWYVPCHQIVKRHCKRPPVNFVRIRLHIMVDHLWSQELLASAKRMLQRVLGRDALGKPEIGQHTMPLLAKQHVLWFHVPVDDAIAVQMVDGKGDLRKIELGTPLAELPARRVLQMEAKISAGMEFHDAHDQRLGAKAFFDLGDKRVRILFDAVDHHPFLLDPFQNVVLFQFLFVHGLNSNNIPGCFPSSLDNFSITSTAQHGYNVEILHRATLARCPRRARGHRRRRLRRL